MSKAAAAVVAGVTRGTRGATANNSVVCPGCGRLWRSLADLLDVRSIGLALKATCPECGELLAVNVLWHKTGEATNDTR